MLIHCSHISRLAGLSLILCSIYAGAMPVSVIGGSGSPGDTVSAILVDDAVSQFDAATFQVEWDPSKLGFLEFKLGTLTNPDFSGIDAPSSGRVDISLASGAAPLDGVGGSIVEIVFTILAAAIAGPAPVTFSCTNFGPGLGCVDYTFPQTSGVITVLSQAPGQPVPGPLPLWLMVLGMAILVPYHARR